MGDGVADDTAAIQAALTFAATNSVPLRGIGGRAYRITSALIVNGSIDFDLCGDVIDGSAVPDGTTFNEVAILKIQGSIGSNVTVTSDVAVGAKQLALSSTSGFSVGDYLLLSSDQRMVDGYGNAGSLRGELNRVESVNSGVLLSTAGEMRVIASRYQRLKLP